MSKYTVPVKAKLNRTDGIRYMGNHAVIPRSVKKALSKGRPVEIEQNWQQYIYPGDVIIVQEEESKKKVKSSKKVAIDIDGDGVADVVGEIVEEEPKAKEKK